MDLVRKIRNHFAHHVWEASFDSAPVLDWCSAIEVVDSAVDFATSEHIIDSNPPRIRYLLAVGMSMMLVAHSPKIPSRFRETMTGIRLGAAQQGVPVDAAPRRAAPRRAAPRRE